MKRRAVNKQALSGIQVLEKQITCGENCLVKVWVMTCSGDPGPGERLTKLGKKDVVLVMDTKSAEFLGHNRGHLAEPPR